MGFVASGFVFYKFFLAAWSNSGILFVGWSVGLSNTFANKLPLLENKSKFDTLQ